jgi:hypothetical protein
MDKGNQLGPYLVTADEVVVKVDGQDRFRGSTEVSGDSSLRTMTVD